MVCYSHHWHLLCETKHALCHQYAPCGNLMWCRKPCAVSKEACACEVGGMSVCLSVQNVCGTATDRIWVKQGVLCIWTYCPRHKYLSKLLSICHLLPFVAICCPLFEVGQWGRCLPGFCLGWQDKTRQDIALSVQTWPGQTRPVCGKVGLPSNTGEWVIRGKVCARLHRLHCHVPNQTRNEIPSIWPKVAPWPKALAETMGSFGQEEEKSDNFLATKVFSYQGLGSMNQCLSLCKESQKRERMRSPIKQNGEKVQFLANFVAKPLDDLLEFSGENWWSN